MESFIYSWSLEESETWHEGDTIYIFSIDASGRTLCHIAENYMPYMHIELPDIKWEHPQLNACVAILNEIIKPYRIISATLKRKSKLYAINGSGTKPYLICKLKNKKQIFLMRKRLAAIKNIITVPNIGRLLVQPREVGISPVLQFCTEYGVPSNGWASFPSGIPEADKRTLCDAEYIITGKNITGIAKHDPVNAKILAWDIEVFSSDGTFPKAEVEDNCIFQISCIFGNVNKSDHYRRYLLTLNKCDPIPDVTVYEYATEADLIHGFVDLVLSERPHCMTGWNIFSFDINYLLQRAKLLGCLPKVLSMNMIIDKAAKETKIIWQSKAYGTTDFRYISTDGVLNIDLIDVVQKAFKLDSYSLNEVSKHFLGSCKDDLDPGDIFRCYATASKDPTSEASKQEMTKVGRYCVQDSVLVLDLFIHLQTWYSLSEMAAVCSSTIMDIHTRGLQIRVFNMLYRHCTHVGIVVDKEDYTVAKNERYRGAEVLDPVPGLYENVVSLDFNSLYPSIMQAYNLCYTTFVKDDDPRPVHTLEWEDHVGCDHDPSVIRKTQLDKEIAILQKDKTKHALALSQLVAERSAIKKPETILCCKRKYKFLKEPKGVIPTIIQYLLDARKEVRALIKQLKAANPDDPAIPILEQKQLALKITANSMYGATGVQSGRLPFMPIAMCTTYVGRVGIQKTKQLLEQMNGKVIYGDTDSNYVTFSDVDLKSLWKHAVAVAKEISTHFPDPINLEFENAIYTKFLILSKKRYMYYSCDADGKTILDKNGQPKIGRRGVILSRRDNARYMKDVYTQLVHKIFGNSSQQEIYYDYINLLLQLFQRTIAYDDLMITKSVGDFGEHTLWKEHILVPRIEDGKYKVGSYTVAITDAEYELPQPQLTTLLISKLPAQVQLKIRMHMRGDPLEGNRLSYIMLDTNDTDNQSQKIESASYFRKNSQYLQIDYLYYIERLIDPVDQIFDILYKPPEKSTATYSAKFAKTKLCRAFARRQRYSLTKELHKTCSNKKKVIQQLQALTRTNILVQQ